MQNKQPSHQEQVGDLETQKWSPTRVIAEHELAMSHVKSGHELAKSQHSVAKEALIALEGLERTTGIPRITAQTEEGMNLLNKKFATGLSEEEKAVDTATRAWSNAEIVAKSAESRAKAAGNETKRIKDAHLDVLRGQAVKDADSAGVQINPMVENPPKA